MSQIDRTGNFRGKIVDRGVGTSSGGFPQAILQLEADQMWDTENGVWIDWEYDVRETIAYLILFGKNGKPTASARQLMKALGWDGVAFIDIQENEKLKDEIQWQMGENTYEGNTTIRCQWIDAYDAVPGRKVNKLEKSDIAALQAKYAGGLAKLSGGPKAKAAPPAEAPTAPVQNPTPPVEAAPIAEPAAPAGPPQAAPTDPPASPDPPAPTPPATEKPKRSRKKAIDMGAAWAECFAAGKAAGKTDVEVTNIWTELVKAAGGNDAVGKNWTPIKEGFEKTLKS
ncbi:MAG: hypothetical protein GY832_31530 [Chloroflexi bacterium]|nr:hypothetical protein [Chloroflexota bacterium]